MKLKVYADRLSQPSRAVIIFCKVNAIDFEEIEVSLAKQINPMEKVPAITDGRLKLFESHAILIYISCAFPGVADHWYPNDLSKRAKIHSVLDWHHSNLRFGTVNFVFNHKLAPALGLPSNPEAAAEGKKILSSSLAKIESFWLKESGRFLVGSNQPSIADLSLVCEIMQLELLDEEERIQLLGPHNKVQQWIENTKNATSPHFDEVHKVLFKVKENLQKQQSVGASSGTASGSKTTLHSKIFADMSGRNANPWDLECPEHFSGRLTSCTKHSKVMNLLHCKLTDRQKNLFRESIFGRFLDMDYTFSGTLMHNVLIRRVVQSCLDGNEQLWFRVGNEVVRLSIREWCLVTGLNCGVADIPKAKTGRLRDKHFPLWRNGASLDDVDKMFNKVNFKRLPDQEAVMIAQYYFADRMLLARPEKNVADFNLMGLMDNKEEFENISWGRLTWDCIYEYAMKSMNDKYNDLKKTQQIDPNYKERKYTFYGFVYGFQAWIFEAVEALALKFAVKLQLVQHPRIFTWKLKKKPVYRQVFDELQQPTNVLKPKRELVPSAEEEREPYWATIRHFDPTYPYWVVEFDEHRRIYSEHVVEDVQPDPLVGNVSTHDQTCMELGAEGTSGFVFKAPSPHVDAEVGSPSPHEFAGHSPLTDANVRFSNPHEFAVAVCDADVRSPSHSESSAKGKSKYCNDYIIRKLDRIESHIQEERDANIEFRQRVIADMTSIKDETTAIRNEIATIRQRQTIIDQRQTHFKAIDLASSQVFDGLYGDSTMERPYSDPHVYTPTSYMGPPAGQDVIIPDQPVTRVSKYRRVLRRSTFM